ncbi:16S rRNA (cytosine(1402)-N(4))-methyltransferase RsmH [Ichthyobacterium seriolicida]|uniref:Ribosomal RNA small subunit methyltransferase H n=1 Tax=Ichthyobacterium seriolicida TaxID=242600 RepID=A0A1J1E5C9_9FLAO|nr:16S rRNA (cytosine(1402)-N(4))-methyltransferase RsmH [Ichthyobacterium seriolicida]BAV95260.1 rRNA small subunit methyltransferase H [Ichthyobacterium seriolicida]
MIYEYHNPVLLSESIIGLDINRDGIYVDVTFGGGGHSAEILNNLGEKGMLFAFDQDKDSLKNAIDDPRFMLINQNFKYLKNYLKFYKITKVDGIIADLGVSSHQLDTEHRGFSIRYNGDLDMRMNTDMNHSAMDIINTYQEEELSDIFNKYGEIKNYKVIAQTICVARKKRNIKNISDLKEILSVFYTDRMWHKFFAKLFQAIRIEVNDELNSLKVLLKDSQDVLNVGGRLVVISYHSLEDRLVKRFIKNGVFESEIEKDIYGNTATSPPFKAVNKRVIKPSYQEVSHNNRSRSARLRIAVKV